jgi:hypothetical protein
LNKRLLFIWWFLGTGLIVSFQNCGSKGFQSQQMSSELSAQCQAAIKKAAPDFSISPSELNCGDFNRYACERRIFSPDLADMTHSLKECLPGDRICVDVDVRQFNTSGARRAGSQDESEFAPGGEYNRQEVNCYHRMVYRGVTLFEGHADSMEEALAQAMAACERTQSHSAGGN